MQKTIFQLSKELNFSEDTIKRVYKAYWKGIHEIIESLPLKEDLDEDTFSTLKTNFNIPNLGKLSCTFDKYIKTRLKYKKNAKH